MDNIPWLFNQEIFDLLVTYDRLDELDTSITSLRVRTFLPNPMDRLIFSLLCKTESMQAMWQDFVYVN